MRDCILPSGIHDGEKIPEVGMSADGVIDMGEGKVVPLDIEGSKVRMAAGSQEVSLGVSLLVSKFVAKMAEISVIVASGSAIRSVYGLSPGSCPEGSKSDLKDVPQSGIRACCGLPEVVAYAREGAGTEFLKAMIGFSFFRDCAISSYRVGRDSAISNRGLTEGMFFDV
jgi:hypothetical protein